MALYTYKVVLVFDTKTRSACWEECLYVVYHKTIFIILILFMTIMVPV